MRTRFIYRIEGTDGNGMFRGKSMALIYESTHIIDRHNRFNTPKEDNLRTRCQKVSWFCAYKTQKELKLWVKPNELRYLINKLEFVVLKIKVNMYQKGEYNILFDKNRVLERIDITDKFR